jgi:hypothetical protein
MSAWVVTVLDGLITGMALYGLVRLRMKFGPIADRKWGTWGRRTVWILLITVMVIVAEADLIWLRNRLEFIDALLPIWRYEATYAVLFLTVGLLLVCRRIFTRRAMKNENCTKAGGPNE